MTANGWIQLLLYVVVLLALAKPLGEYMARVFESRPCGLDRILGPLERLVYRMSGIRPDEEMTWKSYALAMLAFNLFGLLAVYALHRFQAVLPWNPAGMPAVPPHSSWNTAVSFATNTNWQNYGGETTLSYFTQMLGLTVQNFVSAASGIAVLIALIRGFVRHSTDKIGNFWTDMVRSTLYVLLPLSLVLALVLVSQGVVQTMSPYVQSTLIEPVAPVAGSDGTPVTRQTIAVGPAASQIAIKQLGTNGGGFFNVNSSHPFENPTPFSNFLEAIAILLIAAALCFTFGTMVRDRRQGIALLAAMTLIFVPLLGFAAWAEQGGTPTLRQAGVDLVAGDLQAGGNMEGKETRFGVVNSALWATATTAASNGSVNSMHDSFTPLGGLVPIWLMQLGEVVYGGVGSGLYGLLMFAIVAVFVAGLMVGRTPEYLGKKIEAHEMKAAALTILVPTFVALVGTAVAVVSPTGLAGLGNPGAHGLSEILYAFSSAGNNNGSAFGGLTVTSPFYSIWLGFAMLFSRYFLAIPVLAIAGSLARKKFIPPGAGTLPTDSPLFVVMLIGVVLIVGALTFLPALALGPIAEHLQMIAGR
ncbi:MAG: potassium-transporting ATPase subunit KdpA [Thermoanaerobaculia bacterium]